MPFIRKQPALQTYGLQVDRWVEPKNGKNKMAFGCFDDVPGTPDMDGLVFESSGFNPDTAPVGTVINVTLNRMNDNEDAYISEFVSIQADDDDDYEHPDNDSNFVASSPTPTTPPATSKILHALVNSEIHNEICREAFEQRIDRRVVAGAYLEKGFDSF